MILWQNTSEFFRNVVVLLYVSILIKENDAIYKLPL